MADKLMTAAEVAEMTGMTLGWVYSESRAGRIPTIKLGRYRRFRREAIERWLEDLERGKVEGDNRNAPAARERPGARHGRG
jgi:excisionase family DNA binding protein